MMTTIKVYRTHHWKAAEQLTRARHASAAFLFFFLICTKSKIPLELNNNNKQTITIKPLKSRLKNSTGKGNVVIILFYQI